MSYLNMIDEQQYNRTADCIVDLNDYWDTLDNAQNITSCSARNYKPLSNVELKRKINDQIPEKTLENAKWACKHI